MMVRHISSGSPFEPKFGYSRAVVDGDMVYVSGTTGADQETGDMPSDLVEQTRNTLATITSALDEAGASIDDVVRARYFVKDLTELDRIAPVLAETFAAAKPAATLIVADLIDDRMKIEIEVTARIGAHLT